MKQWRQYRLIDILDKIIDYRGKTPQKTDSGIPLITAKIIKDGRILPPNEFIAESNYDQWMVRGIPHEGDVVLTVEAPLGEVAQLGNEKIALAQRVVTLRGKEGVLDNTFLKYFLMSQVGQARLKARETGTTVTGIKQSELREVLIDCPEYDKQVQIASILRSIDNKIENNRQINDNLEQQASSLLSDWISTYPCRTYKLSDICKYANAKCETGNLTPQNYISTENMLPNKKGIVEASNIPTGKATWYKVDDILIANIRPYFQKIWKADINGGCSADVLCIRANIESHSPILYWLLHQDAFFEYVMTGAKGCKMPRGDKQHIMNWSIDLPEVQYWADLATQLGSIDQQIAYNRIESINLSNLRDTLLPKLMSGELKINEIDC